MEEERSPTPSTSGEPEAVVQRIATPDLGEKAGEIRSFPDVEGEVEVSHLDPEPA